ncbi:MAG: substrate-binding domain-containing protein [Lawsonibacter sp.]|nr:substrate-binding domain-containing protein [Lawsonibacter sp.]
MKKRRNALIQLTILVTLGLAVILTMVLPQMSDGRKTAPPSERSVVIRESDSTWWSNTRLGMEQAAGELGAELRFLTLTTTNDAEEQEELLGREVEGGADALVVVSADPERLSGRLKELVGQHPVVAMESPLEGAALTVIPDNEALGRKLAQAVLEDWTGGAVLLLDTGGKSTGVSARMEAAQQVLTAAGVPVQRRISKAAALGGVLAGLTAEAEAVQVMTFEPAATEQAAAAKESGGLTQPLYGVGMTANIAAGLERGTVSAVVTWSDYAAGYLAVEEAIRAARGESYKTEALPFFLVRGEDMYDPDNQKLLFPVTS